MYRGAGVRRGDDLAFLMATGLRIGEACAARRTDLDLDAGTLTVAGT